MNISKKALLSAVGLTLLSASASATITPFDITIEFDGGLTQSQQDVF